MIIWVVWVLGYPEQFPSFNFPWIFPYFPTENHHRIGGFIRGAKTGVSHDVMGVAPFFIAQETLDKMSQRIEARGPRGPRGREGWTLGVVKGYKTVDQWPFQDPRLEVPSIYKAYFLG